MNAKMSTSDNRALSVDIERIGIERLWQIEKIKAIERDYERDFGVYPTNISNWLTSKQFDREMLSVFESPTPASPIDYVYTYSIDADVIASVQRKLTGDASPERSCAVMPNTTQAIVNVVNMLKQANASRVCLVTPAYFSIKHALGAFGVPFDEVGVVRSPGGYRLPWDEIAGKGYDAVWVTSPVFSTSQYYGDEVVEELASCAESGTLVITDESFALAGRELLRRLPADNVIGIYSPHKSICVNSFKFSLVVAPVSHKKALGHWVDVMGGNLPGSCLGAVRHYASDNYDACLDRFTRVIGAKRLDLARALEAEGEAECDLTDLGSLYTVCHHAPNLPRSLDLGFLREMIYSTGVSVYPGAINGFNGHFGFCYRVNLAMADGGFFGKVRLAWDYLNSVSTVNPVHSPKP